MSGFEGDHILITGASGAVGLQVTKRLIKQCYEVKGPRRLVLLVKDDTALNSGSKEFRKITAELNGEYDFLRVETLDMCDPARITQKFEKIMKQHFDGKLDKLIVCHGSVEEKGIYDSDISDYDQYMNLNMRSYTHMVSLAVPFMKQVQNASITILTSTQGFAPEPTATISCTAHAMVHMLIKAVALQVAYFKIRINGVASGIINSNARVKS